jgi:beta-glucosidase
MSNLITFPEGFLWGAATASHQVEGNNRNNDWWQWEKQPNTIAEGGRSGVAADWWAGRAEEDLRRAAAMGHTAHRLSLEWSRLEPTPGVWDDAAFNRYRTILKTCTELRITPVVTMYHFTLPRWASEKGGWRNPDLAGQFGRYAAECMLRLGDVVSWWATMNEPMILIYMAYVGKRWTPGAGSVVAGSKALTHMLKAHHAGYVLGKAIQPNANIGIVLNLPAFDPDRDHPLDRLVVRAQDFIMNGLTIQALKEGILPVPLSLNGQSLVGGERALDWIGLNYYGQHRMRFDLRSAGDLFGRQVQAGVRSEHGGNWGDIYPEGIVRGLRRLSALGKPMMVTENGMFDPTDTRRPAYLLRHIKATHDAIREGLDVRGYFCWTLVDNFEWAEGWTTPFGLLELDPKTQERTPRRSAYVYEQVARANGIPQDVWDEAVAL